MTYQVFDTTLRDGAQREGISYSVVDKLAVARLLDEFGVGFIEGGWPGAMPKDTEFFRRARTELELTNALLVAFGATRKANVAVAADPQVQALLDAGTPVVCVVAKSDIRHVERALRTTGSENLAMVRDTVAHLVANGRRAFVDCEHFFDGFRYDPDYTASVVRAAFEAGAERVVMCDTNGGMLPSMITAAIQDVVRRTGVGADRLGIHCQNDTSCAVANTVAAVEAGVEHFQCTANGYGERPGNADLFAVVSNLQLKLGRKVLPDGCLEKATRVASALAEIANIAPDTHQAYVGAAAFAHKAGLHASAIKVDPLLYNHVDPAVVGNDMRILVTEMAGRASIELKSRELGIDLAGHPDTLTAVTRKVKELEAGGWSFEAADASFELLVRGELPGQGPVRPFALESYRVQVEHREDGAVVSEATVKIRVRGERVIATAEGNGPVNALDLALRKDLGKFSAEIADLELVDFKVRILDGGTGAVTRVLVESRDASGERWYTIGVSPNIIDASFEALYESINYKLLKTVAQT
jgi:2-isopropylmalate synthase